jgi:hypothetical protein
MEFLVVFGYAAAVVIAFKCLERGVDALRSVIRKNKSFKLGD